MNMKTITTTLWIALIGAFFFFSRAPIPEAQSASPSSDWNQVFVALSKKIVPSVVNISTLSVVKSPFLQGGSEDVMRRFFNDFFRQYRGRGPDSEEDESPSMKVPKAMSLGTGFVIDASGLILTNNHVIADADEIKINFTESKDEQPSDAEVVGRDPEIDLALIQVKTKRELVALNLGDSDALEVGEWVIAVGNPFGQGHSVTHGIISAKGRNAPDFPLASYIQTDTPINPGNSGGPLVNLKGEVIAINNAIDQRAQNIGFAIPVNIVKKVLPQLKTKGTVSRGYIGVLVNVLSPEVSKKMGIPKNIVGPVVSHIYPGEPADQAGLKPYDVILEFDHKPIQNGGDLIAAVTGVNVGTSASIKIWRNKQEKTLTIKVAERPGSHANRESKKSSKKSSRLSRMETGMILEDMTPEILRELNLPPKASGAVVSQMSYAGPADHAGLLRGDVILEVDRKPIKDVDAFYAIVKQKKSYLLRIRRMDAQGRELFTIVTLDLT
jgi:serine protease Do